MSVLPGNRSSFTEERKQYTKGSGKRGMMPTFPDPQELLTEPWNPHTLTQVFFFCIPFFNDGFVAAFL